MAPHPASPGFAPADYVAGVVRTRGGTGRMPPDQLLRRAFEVCEDFAAARRLLETTPVARPAIYTLVGCAAHERCVIERTETGCVSREENTCAANDWVPRRPGWEGRIGTRRFLVSSFDDAAGFSRARRDALAAWSGCCLTEISTGCGSRCSTPIRGWRLP